MNANKTETAPTSTENCTPSASAATKPLGDQALVRQAVNALDSTKGFSRKSICSYILANGNKKLSTSVLDRALGRLVKRGALSRNKQGSYRLTLKKASKNKAKVLVAKRGRRRSLSKKRVSIKRRRKSRAPKKSKKSKKGRKGRKKSIKGRARRRKRSIKGGRARRRKSTIKKRRRH